MTTDLATDHREVVRLFFEGDRSIDRLSLLSERCVWWNGLGRLPGAEGRTEFVGRDEIGEFLLARGGHHRLSTGEVVDRYDLTTARFADVVTIADGDFVFRQHTYTAKTMGGRDYENAYGFLFHFDDDGLIDRIWEHWGTLAAWDTLFHQPGSLAAVGDTPPRRSLGPGPQLTNDELLDDDTRGPQAPRPRPSRAAGRRRGVPAARDPGAERLQHPAVALDRRRRPASSAPRSPTSTAGRWTTT